MIVNVIYIIHLACVVLVCIFDTIGFDAVTMFRLLLMGGCILCGEYGYLIVAECIYLVPNSGIMCSGMVFEVSERRLVRSN